MNENDVPHEILHGIYHKYGEYRELVNNLYESLDTTKIYKILRDLGYPDQVIIDEFQAYLFSETDPYNYFKISHRHMDKTSMKKIEKCCKFLTTLGFDKFSKRIKDKSKTKTQRRCP